MTAKEKVLAFHREARLETKKRLRRVVWSSVKHAGFEHTSWLDSEEAAWQNAAESLPAQTEQEMGRTRFERIQGELDSGLAISNDDAKWMLEYAEVAPVTEGEQGCNCPSDGLGPMCDYCCNKPPVAPVDACPLCGSTSKYITKAGWRCLDRWHYETEPVAKPKPTPAPETRLQRQRTIGKWCIAAFGEQEATSLPQRGIRLFEEAGEAAQATGVTAEMAHAMVNYVWSRPVGKLFQELGGVGVTTLALAQAALLDADECEAIEVQRVLSKPLKHFTKRNQTKNDAGFLVQPQDAKEKVTDLVCNSCGRIVGTGRIIKEGNCCNVGTYDGYKCAGTFEVKVRNSNEFGAEPKPTPSSSAPDLLDRMGVQIKYPSSKPQPDSSSIPEEKVWRHLVKRMYDCGSAKADDFIRRVQAGEHDVPSPWIRDSSSISTEQTFEEWWEALYNKSFWSHKEIAELAWNAAKGQSNDR